jgi:predicted small lipoprotein YifL
MKKIILLFLEVLIILTISACGGYTYVYNIPETDAATVQELFAEYGGTLAYS